MDNVELMIQKFNKENLALMQNYAHFEIQMKELEKEKAEIRAELLKAMQKYGIKGIDNKLLKITVVAGSTTTSLDTQKFRASDPDLYEDLLCTYKKVSSKGEHLRINVKEKDDDK